MAKFHYLMLAILCLFFVGTIYLTTQHYFKTLDNLVTLNEEEMLDMVGGCGGFSCCCIVNPSEGCELVLYGDYFPIPTGAESSCKLGASACPGNSVTCVTTIYSDPFCIFEDCTVNNYGNPIA